MSLDSSLFIGWSGGSGNVRFPLKPLLEKHAILRDTVAALIHKNHELDPTLWSFISVNSFAYAFNVYKALELVLPERYHESGMVILRQMWEVTLNMHWVEKDIELRSQNFCNFTVMEMRKNLQKTQSQEEMKNFDAATKKFTSQFHYQDSRGKNRRSPNFADSSIEERAKELGDPWQTDYSQFYTLASMHAHGAPGAVFQSHFVANSKSPAQREEESSGFVAYFSMRVLMDGLRLLVRNQLIENADPAERVFAEELKSAE